MTADMPTELRPGENIDPRTIPLCLDLDGTLIRSDLLIESALALLARNPGLTGPDGEAARTLLYLFRKDLAIPLIRAG